MRFTIKRASEQATTNSPHFRIPWTSNFNKVYQAYNQFTKDHVTMTFPNCDRDSTILKHVTVPFFHGGRHVYMTTRTSSPQRYCLEVKSSLLHEAFLRSFLTCVRDRCLMISFAQPCAVCIENFSLRATHC